MTTTTTHDHGLQQHDAHMLDCRRVAQDNDDMTTAMRSDHGTHSTDDEHEGNDLNDAKVRGGATTPTADAGDPTRHDAPCPCNQCVETVITAR